MREAGAQYNVPCVRRATAEACQPQLAYKKAATKAPKPTMEPAAALRLTAAPAELEAPVPEAVEEALPEPEWRPGPVAEPEASGPVALTLLEVGALKMIVVELLALTVMVELLPGTGTVWMPDGPTAGMVTAVPTLVSAAGWVGMTESAAGWVGIEVAAAGMPVTTPRELVCWR